MVEVDRWLREGGKGEPDHVPGDGQIAADCQHPDWRLSYLPGAGEPIDGPLGARRLLPVCSDCGEPVIVGLPL